jgi:hypothetical protein
MGKNYSGTLTLIDHLKQDKVKLNEKMKVYLIDLIQSSLPNDKINLSHKIIKERLLEFINKTTKWPVKLSQIVNTIFNPQLDKTVSKLFNIFIGLKYNLITNLKDVTVKQSTLQKILESKDLSLVINTKFNKEIYCTNSLTCPTCNEPPKKCPNSEITCPVDCTFDSCKNTENMDYVIYYYGIIGLIIIVIIFRIVVQFI